MDDPPDILKNSKEMRDAMDVLNDLSKIAETIFSTKAAWNATLSERCYVKIREREEIRKARRSHSKQIRAARRIRRLLFQQVPEHAQKGGNRRHRAVDRARRIDVETAPPQPGEADSKNLRGRSAPLSQLRASNEDHIDPRCRPDRQEDPGIPRRSPGAHSKSPLYFS